MPKRMIVTQPPPRPTPLTTRAERAAKEVVNAVVAAARAIPGVEAFAVGDAVKVRIRGESFADIAQKIAMLPQEVSQTRTKTICDGEPVRIT